MQFTELKEFNVFDLIMLTISSLHFLSDSVNIDAIDYIMTKYLYHLMFFIANICHRV